MGPIVQSVVSLTADPGVTSSIPARSHTLLVEILNNFYDHPPPSVDSRRVVASYMRKYVPEKLVNHLVKLSQEKVWLGELTVST